MAEISLDIRLIIVGNPNVRNIRRVMKILKSNNTIDIKIKPNKSEIPEISLTPPYNSETLTVKGQGLALVQLCFEYEDFGGNKYYTEEISITIEKKIPETFTIPVQTFMGGDIPLVTIRSN